MKIIKEKEILNTKLIEQKNNNKSLKLDNHKLNSIVKDINMFKKESIKIVENDKNSETINNVSEKNSINSKSLKIDFPENKIY